MQILSIMQELRENDNLRFLQNMRHEGSFVYKENKKLLNLASNDYLSLAANRILQQEFLAQITQDDCYLSSSSSRSLSGNFPIYTRFESYLANLFDNKEALLFNSGYHLNISCIQALSLLSNTLFVADKLIHASMIDGLRLGGAKFKRFAHNNMEQLSDILQKNHRDYRQIIVLSEGLFSMEGDVADLENLIILKREYPNVLLYLDEAHSIGAMGKNGLGLAYKYGYDKEIDFLVFTFGKAIASVGACMMCKQEYKDFFINKARGLIYSTALAPLNVAWSAFIFEKLPMLDSKRQSLQVKSSFLKARFLEKGFRILGQHYILSLLIGENKDTIALAQKLEKAGFFAPAIKEPTIPKGQARIRFSLCSDIEMQDLARLVDML